MAKINKLSPHVADLIAAGEVVERPGSVIKELAENSIDAGATTITIEIKNGGMTYMRVTDNGCGMAPDDAQMAFLRHATSKLYDERGLEAIGTLGFRGEALAAISSVSRINMLTREADSDSGTDIALEGGTVMYKRPAGCPVGTTVVVRDLFFNTPARLKFMKSDRAEGANVSAAVMRLALSHPEISIRYIKDGKEEYHTPGDGKMQSCAYSILGRDFASGLLEVQGVDSKIPVSGFITAPVNSRGNRNYQFFFINGRFVKSKTLQAALEQAYKNSLFTGKFPACVLYINLSFASVDVNVHPSKTEVKFLNEKEVFDAVYYSVLAALEGEKNKAEIVISPKTASVVTNNPPAENKPYAHTGTAKTERNDTLADTAEKEQNSSFRYKKTDSPRKGYSNAKSESDYIFSLKDFRSYQTVYQPETSDYSPTKARSSLFSDTSANNDDDDVSFIKIVVCEPAPEYRIIGEALTTYIIVEQGSSLFLIDKHAAHERMLFDKLKAQKNEIMSQQMLVPFIFEPDSESAAVLIENKSVLEGFGFDIDEFGENKIALRAVPADMREEELGELLSELADALTLGRKTDADAMRDEILHSIACRAAIKAGTVSPIAELKPIADAVMSGKVKYCPHGRPVSMELGKNLLDKNFKRI